MQYFWYTWNYRNWLCFVSFLKFRSTKLCKRLKTFCQYFVKFCKKFAIMKLLSSFNCFDNFKTGHVSDFAIHKTTKLSTFCRALLFRPYLMDLTQNYWVTLYSVYIEQEIIRACMTSHIHRMQPEAKNWSFLLYYF